MTNAFEWKVFKPEQKRKNWFLSFVSYIKGKFNMSGSKGPKSQYQVLKEKLDAQLKQAEDATALYLAKVNQLSLNLAKGNVPAVSNTSSARGSFYFVEATIGLESPNGTATSPQNRIVLADNEDEAYAKFVAYWQSLGDAEGQSYRVLGAKISGAID